MEKFDLSAAASMCEPAALKVSPDGKYAAYNREYIDYEQDFRGCNLFLLELESGRERQFTFDGSSSVICWLDDETVLFQTERDTGKEEGDVHTIYYRIKTDGGEAEEAFSIPLTAMDIRYIGNGQWLVLALEDSISVNQQQTEKWILIDEYPYRSNGRGYTNGKFGRLYIYNEKEKSVQPITDDSMNIAMILLMDESEVYYTAGSRNKPLREFHQNLYRMNLNTGKTDCIFCRKNYAVADAVMLQGRIWMALMTDGPKVQNSCFDMASMLPDGEDFRIEHKAEWMFGGMSVKDDMLYTMRGWHAQTRLYKGNAFDESDCCLTDEELDICEFCCENNEELFIGRKGNGLREIYRLKEEKVICLTERSETFLHRYSLSTPELMTARADDGTDIPFWIMEPTGGNGRKRPAVLSIHGGPDGLYDGYLDPLHQAYAAEGYYVIYCNPRGSLTYGRRFMEIEGGCGMQDYSDLMKCVDTALENKPEIDETRLYVTGCSYGGYMTNWIISHTDRFSAAAPRVSVSNWVSLRGTGDYKELCDWMHGVTPWEDGASLWNRSPLCWAENVKTPTLFVQHKDDYRCPLEQAEQMYTALIERGVETRLLINSEASHFVMSPQQEKHTFEQIIEWFDRHRKGESKDASGKNTDNCKACK